MTLTFGSLFAGIGGFDLGFERAGIQTRWQVEIDPSCRDILARHFPEAARYADVREVNGATLPPVDVIAFGSPCQDLSVAGQRCGMAGERSGLYFEAMRVIQEMRDATDGRCPTLAVWENVEGALSSHAGRDFGAVLDALAECGAVDIGWSVLDSQYWGVAQRRRRVFVVADFGGERSGEILALTESLCGNPAPGRTAWQDIAGPFGQVASAGGGHRLDIDNAGAYIPVSPTLESGTNRTGGTRPPGTTVDTAETLVVSRTLTSPTGERRDGESDTFILQSVNTPRERKQNGIGDTDTEVVYTLTGRDQHGIAHTLRAEAADASEDGTGRGTPIVAFTAKDYGADAAEDISPTLRSGEFHTSHMNGGVMPAIAFQPTQDVTGHDDQAPTVTNSHGGSPAIAFTERTRADGRTFEAQEELAYALGNAASGGQQHSRRIATGMSVRRLTPTECERLQAFPDGWTVVGASGKAMSDSVRYRMLGNAITVSVAAWIGRQIVLALTSGKEAVA